ncbi:MAG: Spy/CpxP family protein refolding chaperone [Terracidiphilus sp.]|jgi:Spy/CpxP family protein refolding chaperone
MKVSGTLQFGLSIAGILLAGTMALGQGPGSGMGAGPGFGDRQPPMERAFGPQDGHGRWWNNPRAVERLKLTDDQRKDFDNILLEHREKLIDLRASLQKAELALEPLMGSDQPDEAKILAQIDKVAQARAELEKANAAFLLAIRAKLTPEQWKLIQAFRAEHGAGRDWRQRGPGGEPGQGGWKQGGQGPYHRQPQPSGAEPAAPPAVEEPPAPPVTSQAPQQ